MDTYIIQGKRGRVKGGGRFCEEKGAAEAAPKDQGT